MRHQSDEARDVASTRSDFWSPRVRVSVLARHLDKEDVTIHWIPEAGAELTTLATRLSGLVGHEQRVLGAFLSNRG